MTRHLSLYWKIFFAFTIGSLLVAGLSIWLSHALPVNQHLDSTPPQLLLHKAEYIVRKKGPRGLRRWASRRYKRDVRVYLLDIEGNSIVGDPGELLEQRKLAPLFTRKFRHHPGSARYERRLLLAQTLPKHMAPLRQLVIDVPNPRSRVETILITSLGSRFLIAALLSAAVCYLLARYFTVPIRRLREASQQLAAGDYDVQVAPNQQATRDELQMLAQDFDRMAARIKETHSNQQRLIHDVSHELRSPLARIQMALGLLEQKDPNSRQSAEWQRIDKETRLIDELVEQILSLPQKNLMLDDAVAIGALLAHCIENASTTAKDKALCINYDNCCENAVVKTRGRLLQGVFENILSNAMRYSPDNSDIHVRCIENDAAISISIRDYGPGVPNKDLQAIFDPFYRLSEARDRDDGGHGLGLAIAKRSVLLHHGEISAVNAFPGLQVTVTLPKLDA